LRSSASVPDEARKILKVFMGYPFPAKAYWDVLLNADSCR
jgi:hypothetical protein